MTLNFFRFFSRADETLIQALIGRAGYRLIQLVDQNLWSLEKQREMVLEMISPQSLLENKDTRISLLNMLRETEAQELCELLNLESSPNPFNAIRSFRLTRNKKKILFDFFQLPLIVEEIEVIPAVQQITSNYPLFTHQTRAVRDIQGKFSKGEKTVLLHMPTGSGKTRTAMNIICEHLRNKDDALVLWLANSEELCSQAMDEFQKAWAFLGNRTVSTYKYWAEYGVNVSEMDNGFAVLGFAKTYAALQRNLSFIYHLADRATLIIMDEAHQAIAPTYKLLLESLFQGRASRLLGLTATPGRTWNDPGQDRKLASFFNFQKVQLKVAV